MSSSRPRRVVEGSCWRCRKRRIKCDLMKPTCSRCRDSGLQCGYGAAPVKWVGGIALRGRNAPGYPPTPHSAGINSRPVLTRTSDDDTSPRRRDSTSISAALPPESANSVCQEELQQQQQQQQQQCLTKLPSMPSLAPVDESSLMPYFVNAVLPHFSLCEAYVNVDLNSITRDNSLQQTVLAISGAHYHRSSKCGDRGAALVRVLSRQSAITSFRKRLQANVVCDWTAKDLFPINVLFCMLDGMVAPSSELKASSLHLQGGFAMLDRWDYTITSILHEGGLPALLLSLFVTMDLVHALLTGRKPHFEPLVFHKFAHVPAWWGCLDCGDPFLKLLERFSELARLGHVVFSSLGGPGSVCPLGIDLLAASPPLSDASDATPTGHEEPLSLDGWRIFCSLYDICMHIYVERALRLCAVDAESVQWHVYRAIRVLTDEVLPGSLDYKLQHCLLLPMLVIGAHCTRSEDCKAIRTVLSSTLSYLSFGNLSVMMQFLSRTWAQGTTGDVTWWEMFGDIAEKVFPF